MKERITEQSEAFEIDIKKLLLACLERWWIILLCIIIGAGASLLYTANCIDPTYRSTITIYVNNTNANQVIDSASTGSLSASKELVNTYMTLVNSSRVLDEVKRALNSEYETKDIRDMIETTQVNETEVFEIAVTYTDPAETQRIANTLAKIVPNQISSLVHGSSAWVLDYAKLPDSRYAPSYSKNTLIGGLIGGVIMIALITFEVLMDVRIKEEEDLTEYFDYPILGQIPNFVQHPNRKGYAKSYTRYAYQNQNGYAYSHPPTEQASTASKVEAVSDSAAPPESGTTRTKTEKE